jgi:hypothetical protein
MGRTSFPVGERFLKEQPKHEFGHSPSHTAGVKNVQSFTFTPLNTFIMWWLGTD